MTPDPAGATRSVALVTLGCARNEVDSEELAGRLAADGWQLVDDAADADVAVVNTCGFIEAAKKDSIDVLLEAADLKGRGRTRAVVAVGCLAQRYGAQLAAELPEADAVLGFDSYPDLSARLAEVLAGHRPASHAPADRRRLLPMAPALRPDQASHAPPPGHGSPATPRALLASRPWAPLKIASGCDRRCTFCAIPSFRGAFVSRPPQDVLAEAQWLAEQGVREVLLVSENSTSYGKDRSDLRLLEKLLPQLAATPGLIWTRVSYLQPAEMRPGLIDAIADTPGVAAYFDLSFQHASAAVLRRMRRFGSGPDFLALLAAIRERAPRAGARSNVIVGFPGETEDDLVQLEGFLGAARLDAVGVFGFSREEGTAAAELEGALPEHVVAERVARISSLVEELTSQRAAERFDETVLVLVEEVDSEPDEDGTVTVRGRAEFQGPDSDGECEFVVPAGSAPRPGDLRAAVVVGSDGVDLIVEAR